MNRLKDKINKLWIALALLTLSTSCINTTMDEVEAETTKVKTGQTLPVFEVTISTGEVISNETLLGKPSVILFFYTPCGDCKVALPIVNEVYEGLRNQDGINWIAISRAEGEADVSAYWQENNLTLPYSAQPTREVYDLFAYSGIPRLYISNSQNTVIAIFDDTEPIDAEQLRSILAGLE